MKLLRRLSLTHWIMVAMLAGICFGLVLPGWAPGYQVISNVFLRLIKCIIAPILFSTLVVGIAAHSDDMKSVGRMAWKALLYFEVATTIALLIGLAAVNLVQPGHGMSIAGLNAAAVDTSKKPLTTGEMIEHVVPKSFIEAAASNDVLQIVFFAIIFALALTQVKGRPREVMIEICEGISETMFKFVGIVMYFAPFGVGAAIALTVSHNGIAVLYNLGQLVLTLYGALLIFSLLVFLPVLKYARVPLRRFWGAVRAPATIAFSTTSSDAALPLALQNMVKFGVPKRVVSFVLPLGYSFNLDGSTLHLALASVFCAQAAGIHLTLSQQLMMMFSLMLSSKGVAAVPRASFVILSGTLVTFGIPVEAALLVLAVDELMDMARTTVNLIGNCVASVMIAKWEGVLDMEHPEPLFEDKAS